MATIFSVDRNNVGGAWEVIIRFLSAGTTDTVNTGLSRVTDARLQGITGEDTQSDIVINSNVDGAEGQAMGHVFFGAITATTVYELKATGF